MPEELTINALVDMAYGTASANGFHDRTGPITAQTPEAQLSAFVPVLQAFAGAFEAVRKPGKLDVQLALATLARSSATLAMAGINAAAAAQIELAGELGNELQGSATQTQARLMLMASEIAEASEAVQKRDKENFAEELGDAGIRLGDLVGATNDHPNHFLGPIDLDATMVAKNERNKTRGHRHGGKLV